MIGLIKNILILAILGGVALIGYNVYSRFSGENPLGIKFDALKFVDQYLPGTKSGLGNGESVLFKFAVMSDIHSDATQAQSALNKAKEEGVQYVIVTGDWTKVGTIDELREIQKVFDNSGLPYYSVPGDHDLWASRLDNFKLVFGSNYQSFDKNNIHHILLDTSDVDNGIGQAQLDWLRKDLSNNNEKKSLVFMHLPPYHPTSYRTIWEKQGENSAVKKQADELLSLLGEYGVTQIFAGDHHLSSEYAEPSYGVKIRIVGAVTLERNLQKPRFDIVNVYEDKSYEIEEVVID